MPVASNGNAKKEPEARCHLIEDFPPEDTDLSFTLAYEGEDGEKGSFCHREPNLIIANC